VRKSPLIRKLEQAFFQIIKKDVDNYSPILINSFPKSGTHLLHQIFEYSLPCIKNYNTFIASMPSITQLEIGKRKTINMINATVNGELVRAHIFYDSAYEDLLVKKKIVHFFIYRDPRDIAISEANYLFDMNKWHRLHKFFKKFSSLDDRIMLSIKGNDFYKTPVEYPNIVLRFKRYKNWLSSKNVYSVKYENLIGVKRDVEIEKIMHYYIQKTGEELNVDKMVSKAISNIDPTKSHTFREGGTKKWKKYFNEEHKEVFKEIGSDLLIELGYEKDLNW